MRTTLSPFLSLLLFLSAPYSWSQLSPEKIDVLVEQAMEEFEVAGVAVAIVKDGEIVHQEGYGVQSIETGQPVTEHSNFAIASNTKAFTAAALSLLVEEGKLEWQDKVKDHLPEFTMYNDYVTDHFNIQDLLTHRSGLGLGAGDLMFFPDGSDFTIDDVLTNFQYFEPVSAFRTQFDYDNLLYLVAGELIARTSGVSYEDFIEQRILRPLGMDNTYASLQRVKNPNSLAMPHSTEQGNIREVSHIIKSINGAAGGIFSNVSDMSTWMLLQLNQGKYGENLETSLFSEENHREMWKIHTVMEPKRSPRYNSHFAGYGLGWFLTDKLGNMEVSHTGGLPGMLSKVTLVPDLELGVVVLTNTESGGSALFSTVSNTIVDGYLGLEEYGWMDMNLENYRNRRDQGDAFTREVWEMVEAAEDSAVTPEKYTGTYRDDWFGEVEIEIRDNQLWFTCIRSPKLNGPMRLYKDHTFAIRWEYQDMNADAFAIFTMDEQGRAQQIMMKGISPNIDFSFDFQDLDLKRINKP